MRLFKYILILILISFVGYSQKYNVDSSQNVNITNITIKLDTIYNRIKSNMDKRNNKTTIELKDAEKLLEELKNNGFKEYLPSVIAMITIIISSIVAYKIAVNQNSKQEDINRKQIDAQLAIAQDQLEQGRQQITAQIQIAQDQLTQSRNEMQENSRITLAQVRANNISAARIEWIQKLRPLLAELISKTSDFDQLYTSFDKLLLLEKPNNNQKQQAIELSNKLDDTANACDTLWNQILLFLNRNEKEHQDLIASVEQLSENIANKIDNKPFGREVTEEELIDRSRAVLKTAWEQAKNIS